MGKVGSRFYKVVQLQKPC